jgi:hypothetical protein
LRSQNSRARFVSTKGINNLNQITMEATENKIEVTYQEAWISTLRPGVEFTFNDVKLQATAIYYNDCRLEDIEVSVMDDPGIYFTDGDEEYEAGKRLLEEMDLDRHLTF